MTNRNRIDRNPARYNQNINEAETLRLFNQPIEFAQSMSRTLFEQYFMYLPMNDSPRQIDDARGEFEFMLEIALHRPDVSAAKDVEVKYTEFLSYALGESREFGVGLGAIMEQLRVGLLGVLDLWNAGMTQGDVHTLTDIEKLRRAHDLPYSSDWHDTDMGKVRETKP